MVAGVGAGAKKTIKVDKSFDCTYQLVTGGDRLSGPGYSVLGNWKGDIR